MARRISQRATNKPDPDVVHRIIADVSAETSVSRNDILGLYGKRPALAARVECWNRIIKETGCSVYGLAMAWGCEPQGIRRLRRAAESATNIPEREVA